MTQAIAVSEIVQARNNLLKQQSELYLASVERLNMRTRELLKNDFGYTLLVNSGRDIAGEIVRRYFDMGDCYITVDQMFDRILHFSYDNDNDMISSNEQIRKSFYNMEDSPQHSKDIRKIANIVADAQKKLFTEDRAKDTLDRQGKKDYRKKQLLENGKIADELTGDSQFDSSQYHADHIQSREAARYNSRYLKPEYVDKMKRFYNSADNMEMIHASANTSKGDVRVCKIDGQVQYLNARSKEYRAALEKDPQMDITYKATADQLVDAFVQQLEKNYPEREGGGQSKKDRLMAIGYLDENGKVKESVKEEYRRKVINSYNRESIIQLQAMNYGTVVSDAACLVKRSMPKIIAGQLLYYGLPPVIFEAQQIIKLKDMTFDIFLKKIKQAGKRIIRYVKSKARDIMKNAMDNSFNKFLKSFFDIIISTLKATVKRIARAAKQVIMSLTKCIKTIADKNMSAAQKADAITKTLSVVIGGIVLEIMFEYMEKQFGLPDWLMEPLQMIVTVLATKSIMLILQKLDLFNAQYGLLVANIERVFNETYEHFISESDAFIESGKETVSLYMGELKEQIVALKQSIHQLDFYTDAVQPQLQQLSEMFAMGIDFDAEWKEFIIVKY